MSESMQIGRKANHGVRWTSAAQFSRQGLQFITVGILAHLVQPGEFGVVSMAMVVIGFANLFKDAGTFAAVIQKKNISNSLLSTVFWLNVSIGTLLTVSIYSIAPLVASFYQHKEVGDILRWLSVSFCITSLGGVHQALLERHSEFSKLAKVEIISGVSGSMVAVLLAFNGAGAYSLVFQTLITSSVGTLLLWLRSSWRPGGRFSNKSYQEIRGFSLPLMAFNSVNYFSRSADNVIVGRFLGPAPLGIYDLAYRLMLLPLSNISSIVGRVMFPLFSSFQDDQNSFQRYYLLVAACISFISFPLMMGLVSVSDVLVRLFFGDKWIAVVPLIWIMAPLGMLQAVGTTVGSIYTAKGRTDLMWRWGVFSSALLVAAFFVGVNYGIMGVAIAYAVVSIALTYHSFSVPLALIGLRFSDLVSAIWRNLLGALLMFLVVLFIGRLLRGLPDILVLSACIGSGAIFYLGYSHYFNSSILRLFLRLIAQKTQLNTAA